MKTLKIYGASDNLIETHGLPGCDEFDTSTCRTCKNYVNDMLIIAGSESIRVHAIYCGSWAFAVTAEQGDYDILPDWPIRRTFGRDVRYSETLEIDVPDNAVLEWQERNSEH